MNEPTPRNFSLVHMTEGVATTTSLVIADGTQVQHKNVMELIRENLRDFEEFGRVAFETRPVETAGGTQHRHVAVLTEEHATLLLTYMRNSAVVKDFKKRLVREFWTLKRDRDQARPMALPSTRELAQMVIDAEDAREAAEKQLGLEVKARQAMESYVKDLEPRAEGYDRFIDSDGTYAVGVVAKMLGTGQNKLFAELRNAKIFIAKGALRNTPYQQYMHHFDVKAFEYTREDGTHGTSYKTRVQPSGVEFIARKLGRTIQQAVTA